MFLTVLLFHSVAPSCPKFLTMPRINERRGRWLQELNAALEDALKEFCLKQLRFQAGYTPKNTYFETKQLMVCKMFFLLQGPFSACLSWFSGCIHYSKIHQSL